MWSVDLSWSEQAKALRMVAIQNPQTFSVDYAKKSISQLRIVGREVHLYSSCFTVAYITCTVWEYINSYVKAAGFHHRSRTQYSFVVLQCTCTPQSHTDND